MPANYVLLERIELNASAASITFANIPQTGYTDLKVVISSRSTGGGSAWSDIIIKPNNSTSSISTRVLYGTGSAAASTTFTTGIPAVGEGTTGTASTFGNSEIYIPNFTSSNFKSFSADSVSENNATSSLAQLGAMLWSNTAAITSLVFTDFNSGNFVSGSTFSLYGLAALGTTPAIAPKASGGNRIDNDGTYWYHTFTSSGTFTPQTGLTADILVVAGGGGTTGQGGGAGGAGGLLVQSSRTISIGTYPITVGGGGAGSVSNSTNGSVGTDTTFDTVTANGGGYGGGASAPVKNGSSGGSGGGATYSTGTGGAATQGNSGGATGYGFAGSAGINSGGQGAGGGGGAGGVASAGTTSNGGNGGIGRTDSLINAIGAATGAGQLVSSNYYFAGGGGGGIISGTVGAGGSGGGGAGGNYSTQSPNGTAGTVNTGGGAGGRGDGGAGFAGGSGIIVVRYSIA